MSIICTYLQDIYERASLRIRRIHGQDTSISKKVAIISFLKGKAHLP
jgi:hypothetical protein